MLVTKLADLKPALAAGGEITLAAAWDINVSDVTPAIPAVVTGPANRLLLTRCHNLVFEGTTFRRTATKADGADVFFNGCSDITLSRFDMKGPAVAFNDGKVLVAQGAMDIGSSQRITVEDGRIEGYSYGIRGGNNDVLTIRRNDLSRNQMDGIQLGNRVSDLLIEDNYLHDWLGSLQSLNHDDMIQIYTAGAMVASVRIVIRRNRLVGGAGASTQCIFIKSEAAGLRFGGVIIAGNYVSGDDWHGITLYSADNPVIQDNIVLRKKGMPHNESGNDGIYIQNPGCVGSIVDGNIADRLKLVSYTGTNILAASATPDQMRAALDRMLAA